MPATPAAAPTHVETAPAPPSAPDTSAGAASTDKPQPATDAAAKLEPLRERIKSATSISDALRSRVAEMKRRNSITAEQASVCTAELDAQAVALRNADGAAQKLDARSGLDAATQGDLSNDIDQLEQQVDQVGATLDSIAQQLAISDDVAAKLEALPKRIKSEAALSQGLRGRVAEIKGRNTITLKQASQFTAQLNAQDKALGSANEAVQGLLDRSKLELTKQGDLASDVKQLDEQVDLVNATLDSMTKQLTEFDTAKGWSLVDNLLRARCSTAICFANGADQYWLGIEPLVELPVGISSAIGNTSLAEYINNHELRVDLAAGLRVWLFDDVVSLSVYLSKPLIDSNVRPVGADFAYPGTAVRRAFPGFALGLLFDSIWVGFDRNELRNGDGENPMAFNSDFPPNYVVSSAWTVTIALQPVTAFRTAIGTANNASKGD
jgi:hypothetical protein